MRLFRYLFLAALILGATSPAQANTVDDPQIIIRSGASGTIALFNNTFVLIPANHPGDCFNTFNTALNLSSITCIFGNDSGGSFNNLAFFLPGGSQGLLGGSTSSLPGGSPVFGSVFVSASNDLIVFEGIPLADQQEFEIEFVGFAQGTEFHITPNVPEPSTVALFLTGLGVLAARRRLRKALRSSG